MSTQKIPFSTARWSLHLPPRRCRGIKGSIRSHASSVSSYRVPIVGPRADDHHDHPSPKAPCRTGDERRAVHAPNSRSVVLSDWWHSMHEAIFPDAVIVLPSGVNVA